MQQSLYVQPNEVVLTSVKGSIGLRKGILYLTNSRIIFGKGSITNIESIHFALPLSQVQIIKAHTSGLLHKGQIEIVSFGNRNWFFQCENYNLNSPFVYQVINTINRKVTGYGYTVLENESAQEMNRASSETRNGTNKFFIFMKKVGIVLKILLNYAIVIWRYGNRFSKNGKLGWRIGYLIGCIIIFIIVATNIAACTILANNALNNAVIKASTSIVPLGEEYKAKDNLRISMREIENVTFGESRLEIRVENSGRKAIEYTTINNRIESLLSFPSGYIGFNKSDWSKTESEFGLQSPSITINSDNSNKLTGVIEPKTAISVSITLKYEEQFTDSGSNIKFEYYINEKKLPSARWTLLLKPDISPDPEPPKVLTINVSPSPQEVSLSDKIEITVTFDQRMNPQYGEIVFISDNSNASITYSKTDFSWMEDEKTVILNPKNLIDGTKYTIKVTGFCSAENKLSKKIADDSSQTFTTKAIEDFTNQDALSAVKALEAEGFTVKTLNVDTNADVLSEIKGGTPWIVIEQSKPINAEITLKVDTQENIDEKIRKEEAERIKAEEEAARVAAEKEAERIKAEEEAARAAEEAAREQAEREEQARIRSQLEGNLPVAYAWTAVERYGELEFPYGFKIHPLLGNIAESVVDEYTWYLSCYVTIKNAFGEKYDAIVEANVTGSQYAPIVTSFIVYY